MVIRFRYSFRRASCVMRRAKNAIRDTQYAIRYTLFYNCRECSSSATGTNRPIFLQNKANLGKSQMGVRLNISRDYEKKPCWTFGENKPNQSQSRKGPVPGGISPAIGVAGQMTEVIAACCRGLANAPGRIRTCDLRVMGPTRCRIQIKDTEIVFCCDYIMWVFIDRKEILL